MVVDKLESLVFPTLPIYALSVWGPVIYQDSLSYISHIQNRAVCMTRNVHKYPHVSYHTGNLIIRWLSISLFICKVLFNAHNYILFSWRSCLKSLILLEYDLLMEQDIQGILKL